MLNQFLPDAMTPFFSIIIPAYNRAHLLPETISSLQKQTFENWECIVVDDGSTDSTAEVINQLSEKDKRIRYIFQKNAERSAARNNGAKNAQGNYLLFLDSDDSYTPEHLHVLSEFIDKHDQPVGMIFTNVCYLMDHGIEKPSIPFMKEGHEFEYVLLQPITPSRVCIHKDVFSSFKFDEEIVIVEDLVLWVSIAATFPVYQLPIYTVLYRIHGENSVDLSKDSYSSRLHGLKKLFSNSAYAEISKKIPRKIKKHLLAECYFNIARHLEFVGRYGKMSYMLFKSFLIKPSYRNKERLFMMLSHTILFSFLRTK